MRPDCKFTSLAVLSSDAEQAVMESGRISKNVKPAEISALALLKGTACGMPLYSLNFLFALMVFQQQRLPKNSNGAEISISITWIDLQLEIVKGLAWSGEYTCRMEEMGVMHC